MREEIEALLTNLARVTEEHAIAKVVKLVRQYGARCRPASAYMFELAAMLEDGEWRNA